jgi:hypothetical protein
MAHSSLSLTPRFNGVRDALRWLENRFNGFPPGVTARPETIGTISVHHGPSITQLKHGANERGLRNQTP